MAMGAELGALLQHRLPLGALAWQAVGVELGGDLIRGGFKDSMSGIGGKFRAHGPADLPARPGAPAALFTPRLVHPVGEMLEMHARVADKDVGRGVAEKPGHCGVRQRPVEQHPFIALQIGQEGAVEFQEGPGGMALLPEKMRIGERRKVEPGTADGAVRG